FRWPRMNTDSMAAATEATAGRQGWPWQNEEAKVANAPAGGWPKISIVTPSYNQGEFLEQALRSVLLQNYGNLEFIVMDGGSSDGSVEIIRKYAASLSYWQSQKDDGQA